MEIENKELLKEERLERKRILELRWSRIKEHHLSKRVVKEWLEEELLPGVRNAGQKLIVERAGELVEDLVRDAIRESEENSTSRLERNRRLEAAKKQREKLLDYLNIWWSTLEEGVPELETEMETHPFQRGRKGREGMEPLGRKGSWKV